jgi:hypothetical protein
MACYIIHRFDSEKSRLKYPCFLQLKSDAKKLKDYFTFEDAYIKTIEVILNKNNIRNINNFKINWQFKRKFFSESQNWREIIKDNLRNESGCLFNFEDKVIFQVTFDFTILLYSKVNLNLDKIISSGNTVYLYPTDDEILDDFNELSNNFTNILI